MNYNSKYLHIQFSNLAREGKPHDRVTIAIKRNIKHKIIDDFEEYFMAMELITTKEPILTAVRYTLPRHPYLPPADIMRITRRHIPTYILGDLSARH